MFEFIRKHQRLMLLLVLILILPSFVLIGVSGYSNYVSGDEDIVQIGDSSITAQEFDRARRAQLEEAQRNSPAGFDIALYDNPAVRRQLLDEMINQRLLINVATQDRFSVSDAMLRDSIAATPAFQENGVFSPALYEQRLRGAGLDARNYEQSERGQLALGIVLGPVSETAHIAPAVVQQLEQALTEAREVRIKQFSALDYLDNIEVTDEQLQQWYTQNQQALELPEQVSAEFLLLNEESATASVTTPDEAQLQHYFEQNKSRFVRPARAHLSHIQVSLNPGMSDSEREQAHAKAKKLAAQAQADKDNFAELAKANSEDSGSAEDGGDLGWIVYGTWPAALQNAVFSLKAGDVSEVIEGPGGFHVFKVIASEPEQGQSFEQVKGQIEQELRSQLAADNFADMATQLTQLVYDNEDSLEPAAQALGLKLQTVTGITRQGLLPADQLSGEQAAASNASAAVLDDVRVRQALFAHRSLSERKNAGVIEISPDTIIAVRVHDVVPAHVPAFEDVKASLVERLKAEQALALAIQEGEQELASLQQDGAQTLEGFAPVEQISRAQVGAFSESDLNVIMAIDSDTLPAYLGIAGPNSYRLVQVLKHIPGTSGGEGAEFLLAQLTRMQGNSEAQAVLRALRHQQGVKLLPAAEEEINATSDTE